MGPSLSTNTKRLLVVLLAAWLPMCCCQIRHLSAAIAGGTTDGIALVCADAAAPGCCCSKAARDGTDETDAPAPEGCGKSCCIKGSTLTWDWAPPVDTIGLPMLFTAVEADRPILASVEAVPAPRPPPLTARARLQRKCALLI